MKATQLQTIVSTAQASGTTLADLLAEVRKEWMAQRRAARPKRTPAQWVAIGKKAAATRAAAAAENDRSERLWKEHREKQEADALRLKAYLGVHLWRRYEAACLEGALSGDKDYTNEGVLRKLLGSKGIKAMAADGLDIRTLTL